MRAHIRGLDGPPIASAMSVELCLEVACEDKIDRKETLVMLLGVSCLLLTCGVVLGYLPLISITKALRTNQRRDEEHLIVRGDAYLR
jgi:hypothetical protein